LRIKVMVCGVVLLVIHALVWEGRTNVPDPETAALLRNQDHRVAISTRDGFFIKKTDLEKVYNPYEIVYDASRTNVYTKVIMHQGHMYVKEEES
jgi:hypothetical protein